MTDCDDGRQALSWLTLPSGVGRMTAGHLVVIERKRWTGPAIFSTMAATLLLVGALLVLQGPAFGATSPAVAYAASAVGFVVAAATLLTGFVGRRPHR